MRRKLWCSIGLLMSLLSYGQDHGLLMLGGLPSNHINPAWSGQHTWTLGFGGFNYEYGNEAFTLDDAFDTEDGNKVLNFGRINESISGEKNIHYREGLKTLEVGYRIGHIQWSLGHGWQSVGSVALSKEMTTLLAQGNAAYIGDQVQLQPKLNFNSWNETYLGVSTALGPMRIGLRAKYLNGEQHLSTTDGRIDLAVSDEIYQLDVSSDVEIFNAETFTYNGIDDYSIDNRRRSFKHLMQGNHGLGLDIGASLDFEAVQVFLSGQNLGYINWDQGVNKYHYKVDKVIGGVEILDLIDGTYRIDDTLRAITSINRDTIASFTASLPSTVTLGVTYQVNDKNKLGLVLAREDYIMGQKTAASLQWQRTLGKFITLGVSATYRDASISNVGGHIQVSYGPVRFYVIGHNAMGGLLPEHYKSLSVRAGGYLTIEKIKE